MTSTINPPDKPALDTDVIVIGAGPAGMAAAIELASAGTRVIVLDMQPAPGGQIFRGLEANLSARPATDQLLAALGPTYLAGADLIRRFRATGGIDYRPLTTVWDLRSDGTVGWLSEAKAGYLRGAHVIVASGAMERSTPFEGWTLPGVMTAGAVQTLLKAGRLKPGGRIVLAGTGPLIFLLAEQLRKLGVELALIARTDRLAHKLAALPHLRPQGIGPLVKGLQWLAQLRLAGIPMITGVTGISAVGMGRVERVHVATAAGRQLDIPCDLLVVHDGIVPGNDLAHGAGLALEWRHDDASWQPKTSASGRSEVAPGATLAEGASRLWISGDARRIGGGDAAMAHGRLVGQAILAEAGVTAGTAGDVLAAVKDTLAGRPFLDKAFPPGLSADLPQDDTLVCRCEEISAGALRQRIRAGLTDANAIRGVLRCGMGPCQGRSCAATLARLLSESGQTAVPQPFRARPPIRPLPLTALAQLSGIDPSLAHIQSLDDKPEASTMDEIDA